MSRSMAQDTLTPGEARRLALGAQGLAGARSARSGPPGTRALRREIDRMGILQIDSVNVFARSHYLPLFSRLGAYEPSALDRLVMGGPRRRGSPAYIEYLGHEATFLPAEDWPLWEFRRDRMRRRYAGPGEWFAEHRETVDWVRAELAHRGPLRAGQVQRDAERRPRGSWWDWDDVKRALEMMWRFGEVAVAGREGFERRYALAPDVLPERLLTETVGTEDAIRELVRRAARASGVATAADLADYYRLRSRPAVLAAVRDLEEAGELVPVAVRGWERGGRPTPAWRWHEARIPRLTDRATVLTPFDPVVWFRERAQRLFDFHYRIEIYTPAARRRFGYYSLPVLLGDRIAARVDLKAERASSTLLVQSAWWEDHADARRDGPLLARAVREAAAWQGLDAVSVAGWGDATEALAGELGAGRHGDGVGR
jgi:uncharacterized protein